MPHHETASSGTPSAATAGNHAASLDVLVQSSRASIGIWKCMASARLNPVGRAITASGSASAIPCRYAAGVRRRPTKRGPRLRSARSDGPADATGTHRDLRPAGTDRQGQPGLAGVQAEAGSDLPPSKEPEVAHFARDLRIRNASEPPTWGATSRGLTELSTSRAQEGPGAARLGGEGPVAAARAGRLGPGSSSTRGAGSSGAWPVALSCALSGDRRR